ncbi:universal stress protein [Dictyobacter arantiisoli]|uniref:UspA domain-containing protein n=1 Tax=Dictyobacter arantiisoli TaxID=2014874 RepID=A0A5A5TC02_9CHLR|nr:universal stress protein [Dictyobacter arantiisoli]GCF08676.1 hypothetical protein KDI_22400 [Dictyobacter arantiisoli]
MFKHILVLLGGSKRAEQAIEGAKRSSETTHASLSLLLVIDPDAEKVNLSVPLVFDNLDKAIEQEEDHRPQNTLPSAYRATLSTSTLTNGTPDTSRSSHTNDFIHHSGTPD